MTGRASRPGRSPSSSVGADLRIDRPAVEQSVVQNGSHKSTRIPWVLLSSVTAVALGVAAGVLALTLGGTSPSVDPMEFEALVLSEAVTPTPTATPSIVAEPAAEDSPVASPTTSPTQATPGEASKALAAITAEPTGADVSVPDNPASPIVTATAAGFAATPTVASVDPGTSLSERASGSQTTAPDVALADLGTTASSLDANPAATPLATAGATAVGATLAQEDLTLDRQSQHAPILSAREGDRQTEEPTAAATPEPRDRVTIHKVADGESLQSIAKQYGISEQTITRANELQGPGDVKAGQEIVILPVSGFLHVVQAGDTVADLATRYSVIPEDIVTLNNLEDAGKIYPDQQLVIPSASAEEQELPVAPPPQPVSKPLQPVSYEVKSGDTLFGIAERSGLSMNAVVWSNPELGASQTLHPGQTLTLPPVPGVLHDVAAGESVAAIAAKYGASASEIVRANGLQEPFVVHPGQLLIVPGGTPPDAPTPAPTAAPTNTPKPASTPTTKPAPTNTPKAAPTNTPRPAATETPKPAPTSTPKVEPTAPPPPPTPTPRPPTPAPPTATPKPAPPPAQPQANGSAADAAVKLVGSRYAWAGASPSTGFDCSGLTFYVYRGVGKSIPRDIWGQINTGARVGRDGLQPGDMVFFQNTYTAGLSHVGIYLGGDKFVHAASQSSGVIVSSIGESYWSTRFMAATRP